MASLSNDPNGRRRIQFFNGNGQRKTIRLGKLSKRAAETVKGHVEQLLSAQISGAAPPDETTRWLAERNDQLRGKLAEAGLTEKPLEATLGPFVAEFIASRTETVKPGTRLVWQQAERNLVAYFGIGKRLRDITPGDAEDFRNHLLGVEKLGESTTRKRCAVASMMLRYAVKHRLASANAFDEVPKANMATENHAFVTATAAEKVLAELPNAQWRLLFALSRWGGLRVGSEVRRLEWSDIDWARQRFTVRSPKTERYSGRGSRVVPIFPELAPLFDQRYAEAAEGDTLVLPMLAGRTDASLRRTVSLAIARAGVTVWARLWHNLRSSRQTELQDRFPSHVVCKWLGNSKAVAEKHYLQMTEGHFADAAQNAAQTTIATERMAEQLESGHARKRPVVLGSALQSDGVQSNSIVREGLQRPLQTGVIKANSEEGGADSGALGALNGDFDRELTEVIDRWATLPEAVRLAILALVQTAK